ncbi:MAG TPA: hypothetical protein VLR26_17820 [Frankiaceae bacterium]|nr:hypothetical protein [Frankiaceae bacterium]
MTKRTVLLLALAATTGAPALAACSNAERQAPLPPSAAGPALGTPGGQVPVEPSTSRGDGGASVPLTADGRPVPTSGTAGANITPGPAGSTGGLRTRPGYVPGPAGTSAVPGDNYRVGTRAPWGILLDDRPKPKLQPVPVVEPQPEPLPAPESGSEDGASILADAPALKVPAKHSDVTVPPGQAQETDTPRLPSAVSFPALLAAMPPSTDTPTSDNTDEVDSVRHTADNTGDDTGEHAGDQPSGEAPAPVGDTKDKPCNNTTGKSGHQKPKPTDQTDGTAQLPPSTDTPTSDNTDENIADNTGDSTGEHAGDQPSGEVLAPVGDTKDKPSNNTTGKLGHQKPKPTDQTDGTAVLPTPQPLGSPLPAPVPVPHQASAVPAVPSAPVATAWHIDGLTLAKPAPASIGKGGSAAFRKALWASLHQRPDSARPAPAALRRWSASLQNAATLAPDARTKTQLRLLSRYAADLADTAAPRRAALQQQRPGALQAASALRASLPRRFGVDLLG